MIEKSIFLSIQKQMESKMNASEIFEELHKED